MKNNKRKQRNYLHIYVQTKYRMLIKENKKKYKRSRDKKITY